MEVRGYKPHEDIAIILMILLWKRPSSNIPPFGKGQALTFPPLEKAKL
jgi:hypothetical protein